MDWWDWVIVTAVSTAVGLGLAWWVFFKRVLRPLMPPPNIKPDAEMTFVEGERDRMLSAAKGVAAGSSGFLVALLPPLIDGEVADELTPAIVVLVLLGSIGMLLLAAAQSRDSARYMKAAVCPPSRSEWNETS